MRTVETPESIVGLVTRGMLVMTFLEGNKITQLAVRITQQEYRGGGGPCCVHRSSPTHASTAEERVIQPCCKNTGVVAAPVAFPKLANTCINSRGMSDTTMLQGYSGVAAPVAFPKLANTCISSRGTSDTNTLQVTYG